MYIVIYFHSLAIYNIFRYLKNLETYIIYVKEKQ